MIIFKIFEQNRVFSDLLCISFVEHSGQLRYFFEYDVIVLY